MRILLGQVLPSCPAPQNPQNAIQHATALDPRTATLAVLARFGKQGSDFLPLHFRQQRTRPGHRPSFGAADFAYLSSEKTQLPSFQEPVLGYATASKQVDGRATLDPESERIVLPCKASAKMPLPGHHNTLSLRAEFRPRAMRARGVPDL